MAPLRVLAVFGWAVILTSAVGSSSRAAATQSPSNGPLTALARSLDAARSTLALTRTSWGIAVYSLDRNESLYRFDANRLLMPASTMKVVTLAAAADTLGWDFCYRTVLYRIGPVDNGVLDGDLVIAGSGDPSFDDWDGQATARFAEWAARLKDAGITRVTGRLIGDDNAFDEVGLGNGWAWDDVGSSYSAGVSGLQFNENTAQLVITPGLTEGAPARIEIRPATAPLEIRNFTTTGSNDSPLMIQPVPRRPTLDVSGAIAPKAPAIVRNVSVPNPTLYFATAALATLQANGIEVRGGAVDVDDVAQPLDQSLAIAVADAKSPPLRALASTMMKLSQNLFAESLLKTLGGRPGTAAAGRERTLNLLTTWGVDPADVLVADGSGLSRYNLLTADAQLAVLRHVYADAKLRGPYLDALPLAGVDGTMERRMTGTRAERNARAKTGSFSNARGLAGFVTSADGEALAFSMIANNYNTPLAVVDRAMDDMVVALAQFSRR